MRDTTCSDTFSTTTQKMLCAFAPHQMKVSRPRSICNTYIDCNDCNKCIAVFPFNCTKGDTLRRKLYSHVYAMGKAKPAAAPGTRRSRVVDGMDAPGCSEGTPGNARYCGTGR